MKPAPKNCPRCKARKDADESQSASDSMCRVTVYHRSSMWHGGKLQQQSSRCKVRVQRLKARRLRRQLRATGLKPVC